MSKKGFLLVIALLFVIYNVVVWQHLFTGRTATSTIQLRLYFAAGLLLYLGTVFFTYMLEKTFALSKTATCLYILLLLTGAPFLYKLTLHLILVNIPFLLH